MEPTTWAFITGFVTGAAIAGFALSFMLCREIERWNK